MPRSHRPRKAYRPRRIDPDPIGLAIGRVTTLDNTQRLALDMPLREALDAFRRGAGSREHWLQLADALNVAEAIAARGLFAEDRPDAYVAAQRVLGDVSDRREAGGSWTLRGPELQALEIGIQCHELQLDACSQGELADAIADVKRRIRGVLAGNAPAGARVCTPGLLGRS